MWQPSRYPGSQLRLVPSPGRPCTARGDHKYRADFLIHYDGRVVCVELDGHNWHKTKDQRVQRVDNPRGSSPRTSSASTTPRSARGRRGDHRAPLNEDGAMRPRPPANEQRPEHTPGVVDPGTDALLSDQRMDVQPSPGRVTENVEQRLARQLLKMERIPSVGLRRLPARDRARPDVAAADPRGQRELARGDRSPDMAARWSTQAAVRYPAAQSAVPSAKRTTSVPPPGRGARVARGRRGHTRRLVEVQTPLTLHSPARTARCA